jgi:hypothetical protein
MRAKRLAHLTLIDLIAKTIRNYSAPHFLLSVALFLCHELLFHIQEVPGSNLGQEAGYHH